MDETNKKITLFLLHHASVLVVDHDRGARKHPKSFGKFSNEANSLALFLDSSPLKFLNLILYDQELKEWAFTR